jgi:hypothetical protein
MAKYGCNAKGSDGKLFGCVIQQEPKMDRRIFLAGCCGMTTTIVLRAAEPALGDSKWGDLKGRFVFGGEPPEPARLEITKDATFVKVPLLDESLLVDKENRGLANVVVTLQRRNAGEAVPVHPSYEMAKPPPVETTIRGFRIEPRITVLRTGQELIYVNADLVGHNPKFDLLNNQPPSILVSRARETISRGYEAAEATPASISCAIHPWESAVLVVTDHPYVGVSQADGSFVIKNQPVGQWTFHFWHERCQGIKQATITSKEQKLERGKLVVEIKPGMNDLGDMKIEPTLLDRKR